MAGTALRRLFGVTYYNEEKAFDGYTFFTPMWGKETLLINMKGEIVHKWKFNKRPGDWSYMLPNGNVLFPERLVTNRLMFHAGVGCDCVEVDWDNNLVWKYTDKDQHHAAVRLKNGNTMFLTVLEIPHDMNKKVKGGRSGTEEDGKIYCDGLREVNPKGEVVWEWLAYEHIDPEIFSICPLEERCDWTHGNTCFEMPDGDILTCFRNVDILLIIDKQSGKVKWHWGKGILKHPHMVTYLDNGNILCYDNGPHRENCLVDYSRIVEVDMETKKIVWEYSEKTKPIFYSAVQAGAQRLPNGNTLITEACKGRIFEVTYDKEIVWEYISPFFLNTGVAIIPGWHSWVHRAYRYPKDFSGFSGRKLDPHDYKEFNLIYGPGAFGKIPGI